MQHIKEHNRWQMELTSLDTFIAYDNPVRVIDAFADQLELDKLGFVVNPIKNEGRPNNSTHDTYTCRSEFAEALEENAARYHTNKELYRTRQEINEHIFGAIKRVWGYYYTNLKGLQKVNGEWSLIMLCYNLKRCINILGIPTLLEKLKNYKPDYGKIAGLHKNTKQFKLITRIVFLEHKLAA